ncbi:DUF2975 domain-containing protein [Flavimarina sp. Hel_I_48]|uniref:DUF2975 domain-containing protein n=1 Tax=Flavimarina sp. Hel_I_48 TaxID=1392488 RepID=UPI0004DED32C|nr:DUF2975 domain-containing protein [Flavimarina sp. Hel_I_48]
MRLNKIFKLLIDVAFYLMVPIVLFFPGTILYILIFPGQTVINVNVPFMENGFGFKAFFFMLVFFALFLLFFLGFYQLRKFAAQLLKQRLFSKEVISSTQKAGQYFTICGIGSLVFIAMNALFTNHGKFSVTFGISNFSLLLFLSIVGVLFLLLSDAFKKALVLKEENELTV